MEKSDFIPDTRDIDQVVWTGLCGKEDEFARENLDVFILVQGSIVTEVGDKTKNGFSYYTDVFYVDAPSRSIAHQMVKKNQHESTEVGNVTFDQWYPIAAESKKAAISRWGSVVDQFECYQTGGVSEILVLDGYDSYEESVKDRGPYGVLFEKGLVEPDPEIRAEVRATHLSNGFWSGTPAVEYDALPAIKRLSDDAIRSALEVGFNSGYAATDCISEQAIEYDKEIQAFFQMLNAANTIGVDLGGHDTEIKDKKEVVRWIERERPQVFEGAELFPRDVGKEFEAFLVGQGLVDVAEE